MPQAISKKSWFGVGFEATPGTALTAPTVYVPTKGNMKRQKKKEYLNEERGNRDANYDVVDTTREGVADMKGPWYNDVSPYILIGGMGAVTSTQPDASGSPTVYQHAISAADIPRAQTVFKSYHAVTYYMPYSLVEKFSLDFDAKGKLLEIDGSYKGIYPVKYTGSALTPTYSSVKPFPGYLPTIKLNGLATTDIDQFKIEFTQKVDPWFTASGNPDPTTWDFGERAMKFEFQARFDVDTVYERFNTGNIDSLDIDFKGPLINATYFRELHITVPQISYDTAEHDTGKDNVLIKVKGTILNPASVNFVVTNTVASYAS